MNRKRLATQRWIPHALVLVLLLGTGLAGCKPTPMPPATATPTPELTPIPSATATPEPTPTQPPTATPTLPPPPPEAPVIDPPSPEITMEAGKKIAVRASAEGADRYEWTLLGDGEISTTTGPATLYTAPEEGDGIAVLTVTAYNDQGSSPQTSLTINIAPIAAAAVGFDTLDVIPAGWMSGEVSPETHISLEGGGPNDCHTGSDCSRFTYSPGGGWGGIYWWPLSCGASGTQDAWDRVRSGTCGINVLEAGNLSGVNRLTFWARGDRGREIVEFKVGGVDVLPSPGRSLGRVTLTSTWKQYEIDLEGMDLTNTIGLFCWVATDEKNPQGAVFYLDDIQFQGVK